MAQSNSQDDFLSYKTYLRQRFRAEQSLDGLQEQEVLELLLTFALPRKDVRPIAHELLRHFGTLHNILTAPVQELQYIEGLDEKAAILLTLPDQIARQGEIGQKRFTMLKTRQDEEEYLMNRLYGNRCEILCQLCLDKWNHLRAFQYLEYGSVSSVKLNVSKSIRNALLMNCDVVVIAHNHPGGDAKASKEDILAARYLYSALKAFHITLKDFIIVTDQACTALDLETMSEPIL